MPIKYRAPLTQDQQFWITNLSNRIISLGDLAVHIQPFTTINLLDPSYYHLTRAQVDASRANGSLFARRNVIVERKIAPSAAAPKYIPYDRNAIYPGRKISGVETETVTYEELNISDTTYAEENADTAEADHLGKYKK